MGIQDLSLFPQSQDQSTVRMGTNRHPGTLLTIPFLPYAESLELQQGLLLKRLQGRQPDTLLLTEHEPVVTIGKRTQPEHWESQAAELRRKGIHPYETNRGGSVTYHGPGQLIGYPILHLRTYCPGPKVYVHQLEEVLIRTLAEWGISACRHTSFRGVWVEREGNPSEKLASIGVRISRGITMHGFALNVNVDLAPFSLLTPCGIEHCVMTSMSRVLGMHLEVDSVQQALAKHFGKEFGILWER